MTDDTPEPLVRRLSVVGLWLLIINGIIAGGIFGLPAEAARLAGGFSPWVFAISAGLIAPIILCFAQLGSYFSRTGGPLLYAGTAFGPMVGFQTGWCLYVARLLAFAANVNLLVNSLPFFMGGAIDPRLRLFLMFATCGLLTALNVVGGRAAIGSLSVLTVLKFLPLMVLVSFGLLNVGWSLSTQIPAGPHDIGAAVLLVVYAYVGFENGLVVAGEARNPQRDLPRALLASLFVCGSLYFLIQTVSMATLPTLAHSTRPLVDVAAKLMGPLGALLLTAGVIASVGGNLVGSMFSSPRITYSLALEAHLPRWFRTVHPVYKTPVWSIVFFGASCFLLAASSGFAWLASLSVLTRLLLYLVCILAIPRIKNQFDAAPTALRLPGGYLIPALAVIVCIGLLIQVKALAYLSVAALLAVGTVLFAAAYWSARSRLYRGPSRDG